MDNIIFDKIITEIKNGNFRVAIQHCDEVLKEYPDNRSVFEIRSGCHYALGDYDSAVVDLTHSINKTNGDHYTKEEIIGLYTKRGKIYLEKGDWLKASEDFKKILTLNQNLSEIENSLAVCYRRTNNLSDALYHSSQAIKLNNEYAEAYNNRANINISLEKYHEAILDYSRSIELNPLNANALFNRGSIYYDILNNKVNAIQDFLKAININPKFKEELKSNYPELTNILDNKTESNEEVIPQKEKVAESTKITEEVVIKKEMKLTDMFENKKDDKAEEIIPKEEEIIPKEEAVINTIIPDEVAAKQEDTGMDFSLDDFATLFNDNKDKKLEFISPRVIESISPTAHEVEKADDIVIPEFDLKSIFNDSKDSEEIHHIEEEPFLSDKPVISDDIKSLHDEIQTGGENVKESTGIMSGLKFDEISDSENKEPVIDSKQEYNYIPEPEEEKRSFLRSPIFFILVILFIAIIILLSVLRFFNSQENQITNNSAVVNADSNVVKRTDTVKSAITETVSKEEIKAKEESKIKADEEVKKENVPTKEVKKEAELTTKNLGFVSDKKLFVLFSEPDGYYVQIGSYKEKQKADEKVKLLEKNNIKGKVIEVDLKEKGIFYRVRAGVFATQEEAKEKTMKIE